MEMFFFCIETVLRGDELSFCIYSSVVFFSQFLEFFAQLQCKKCTWLDVKLHLLFVSVEKSD